MNNIKLEGNDGDQMIKQEQFDEDIYAAVGPEEHFQAGSTGHSSHMDMNGDLMENMTDTYSDTSMSKASSKRARKYKNKSPSVHKVDVKAKLERSRQSARECRARKKLRYQYLEDLVVKRENANLILKKEMEQLKEVAKMFAKGCSSVEIDKKLNQNGV